MVRGWGSKPRSKTPREEKEKGKETFFTVKTQLVVVFRSIHQIYSPLLRI